MLLQWSSGDRQVLDEIVPFIYEELRRLARSRLHGERSDHTLNTTGLVHEAYLKLVDINKVKWKDRSHFLAMASKVMRRVLVDYAKKRNAQKRGGGEPHVALEEWLLVPPDYEDTLLELDDALQKLEDRFPRQGQSIELHYFGGLNLEETGAVLDVSPATVMRDLRFAEAWLARIWDGDLRAHRS